MLNRKEGIGGKLKWNPPKVPQGLLQFFKYYPEIRRAIVLYESPELSTSYEGRTVLFAPICKSCKILEWT